MLGGAAGLVGGECLRLLLADPSFTHVVVLARRPLPRVSLLLFSDTAQGTRGTSCLADRYGRDSVVTDVRGTTRLAYHATRGVVDSILTPYADTLTYTIDAWDRAVGPRVAHGPSPDFAVTQTWDDVGKLVGLTTTQPDAVTVGNWEVPGEMPDLDLHASATIWRRAG